MNVFTPVSASISLEQLASVRFQGLSEAEKRLLRAVPSGTTAFCGVVENEDNPPFPYPPDNDPAGAANWGPDRGVRAGLIRWLCVDRTAAAAIDPCGIRVCAAKITGKLDLSYVSAAFPLSFDRCVFGENADFSYLKTPGLSFTGSHMKAVAADGATVGGDLSFDEGFISEGGVRMLTAQIGANLECNAGTFRNQGGHALWADRVKIAGSAFLGRLDKLRSPFGGAFFRAEGTVRLIGAQIGGVLNCAHGLFRKPQQPPGGAAAAPGAVGQPAQQAFALNCDRIKVTSVFFNDRFSAEGEVRLRGADIGINLTCSRGRFSNPQGNALSCDGTKFGGAVQLGDGFVADGAVDLLNCQIGADVDCRGGSFSKLSLKRAGIKGSFLWSGIPNAGQTQLDLTDASVGPLSDEERSWPARENLRLDGFSYSRISGAAPRDVEVRLGWLRRAEFALQPYQQLAKVLKDGGDVDAAPRVLYKMEQLRRQKNDRSGLQRLGSAILGATIGYGQIPLRALWWLLGLIATGFIFFGLGYLGGVMTPNDKDAYAAFEKKGYAPNNYSAFNALIYSVENSFPVMNLGVKAQWQPGPRCAGAVLPVLHNETLRCWRDNGVKLESPAFLRVCLWLQTIAGWVLATLFVAGFTGLVKSS
jgi:hypothetical protein